MYFFLQGHAFACRCACLFAGRGALSRACRRVQICWLIYYCSSSRTPSRANPRHPFRMPLAFIPGGSANSHPGSSSCRFSYPQVPVPFPAPGPRPSRPTIWRYLLCTPGLFPFLRIPSLPLLCLPFSHLRAPGRVLNHELVF